MPVIVLGQLNIPIKLSLAASPESISFKMVTPDGVPINNKIVDSVSKKEYDHSLCKKAVMVDKSLVVLTNEELKSIEPKGIETTITINEFVSIDKIDLINIAKPYYVKPDKGGNRGFKILYEAMSKSKKSAICMINDKGKERLSLLRTYKGGLVLHHLYFKNEIRDCEDNLINEQIKKPEMEVMAQIIKLMTFEDFDLGKYKDGYTVKVMELAQKKLKNEPMIESKEPISVGDFDLMNALQDSLKELIPIKN